MKTRNCWLVSIEGYSQNTFPHLFLSPTTVFLLKDEADLNIQYPKKKIPSFKGCSVSNSKHVKIVVYESRREKVQWLLFILYWPMVHDETNVIVLLPLYPTKRL